MRPIRDIFGFRVSEQPTQTIDIERPPGARSQRLVRPGLLVLCSDAPLLGHRNFVGVGPLTLGRSADQQIFIEDAALSRRHATFHFSSEQIAIEDHGSRNGSKVNGQRIDGRRELRVGDVVRCANSVLLVVADVAQYDDWPQAAQQPPLLGGPAIAKARSSIAQFARSDQALLLCGETGTGKELAAELLHQESGRSGRFVAVNCPAIPATLFEAELFGAERGAYTDAQKPRSGLVEQAAHGTLFLDEVGEIPLELQAKLLRFAEGKEARKLGGDTLRVHDVGLVAATNRDLRQFVEQGRFRRDLYHRLCGVVIELPPLRTRREDIVLIAQALCSEQADAPALSADAAEALALYDWPGNVRELVKATRAALTRARQADQRRLELDHFDLPAAAQHALDQQTQRLIEALRQHDGHVQHAATSLGLARSKAYALLKAAGLRAKDFRR